MLEARAHERTGKRAKRKLPNTGNWKIVTANRNSNRFAAVANALVFGLAASNCGLRFDIYNVINCK